MHNCSGCQDLVLSLVRRKANRLSPLIKSLPLQFSVTFSIRRSFASRLQPSLIDRSSKSIIEAIRAMTVLRYDCTYSQALSFSAMPRGKATWLVVPVSTFNCQAFQSKLPLICNMPAELWRFRVCALRMRKRLTIWYRPPISCTTTSSFRIGLQSDLFANRIQIRFRLTIEIASDDDAYLMNKRNMEFVSLICWRGCCNGKH